MVPYLIWVGYGKDVSMYGSRIQVLLILASALTIAIWQLNSPYAQPPPRRSRPTGDPYQQ